jgi:hypothetical protein
LIAAGIHSRTAPAAARSVVQVARLPRVVIGPSLSVDVKLDRRTALQIAADLEQRRPPTARVRRITLWVEAGSGQGPVIVAQLESISLGRVQEKTVEVAQSRSGYGVARIRP